ncbi:hypothetical protein [Borrelia sp. HM]|uniref:hypothetical protein n=1 Tax=Borrelia sp. HM TaxID=1882662 RepID=UPI001C787214|nr:hypothetical protein [Borrelia sp. HM]BCR21545.1 hypothetical protein BKFM_00107 [Borrelia sp. HM]
MQIKILCKILLMSSTLMLFSNNEQLDNNLKPVLNVEEELINNKSNYNKYNSKEKTKINKSSTIKYPEKKEKIHSLKAINKKYQNLKTNKKQNNKKYRNNILAIKKSSKINYPKKTSHSKKNIWYNIKIYPTNEQDTFTRLKEINNINKQIKTNFALIGPILENNLDEITKSLKIIGYDELEYIKINAN